MNKLIEHIKNPHRLCVLISIRLFGRVMPDRLYLSLLYWASFGKKMDWERPLTFNEKLQWIKLYDRRPEYSILVDKYAVKEFVASKIGYEYVIPTVGVWEKVEDIEWEKLPNKFVLKSTHDSGSVIICNDKELINKDVVRTKLRASLLFDYYKRSREWPYKNVPRRIIAEQYIDPVPGLNDLPDYKFFCFDGKVRLLFVATERSSGDVKFDFFDTNFNHLNITQLHHPSGKCIQKPLRFEKMIQLAEVLSEGIPFVRVDFYNINGRIYFGEMTLFHHGGLVPFHPGDWDRILGEWIVLPNNQ